MGLQVDQGLSFWGEFIDPVLEDEYRLFDLPATKQGIRGFIMIAFVATVVFTVMESLFKSWSTPGLAGVQCTRLVLVLVFPLVWMLVGRLNKPRTLYGLVFTSSLVLGFIALLIPLFRPPEYTGHFITCITIVVSFYILVPMPFLLQVIPPVTISVMEIVVLYFRTHPAESNYYMVVPGLIVIANIVGFYSVRQTKIIGRRRFLAFRKETMLREELQDTLDRLKVVEGLVPICSHCKRIRRDDNFWEEVEAFMKRGSNYEFTHGICPTCFSKHYPDLEHREARKTASRE